MSTRSMRGMVTVAVMSFMLVVPIYHARAVSPATDADGDGYDDATELAHGYSPYGPGTLAQNDVDHDGLSDGDELNVYRTDLLNADTDADGYSDGLEVQKGYDPLKPDGAKLAKRIVITLKTQKLAYYLGPKELGNFTISSGKASTPTPKGTYAVQNKSPRAWSSSAKLWMPDWLGFIGTTYGIHELPEWPGGMKEGAAHLGTPVSHGCVRLGVGPAKTLYDWADVGTQVMVQ